MQIFRLIALSTALVCNGLAIAAPLSPDGVSAALTSREKVPAVAQSIKQVCVRAKDQRLCTAVQKSYIAGLKDYMTGREGGFLVEAAKRMNKAALCMATIAPDLVGKEPGGIRSKITPLSEAYLGTVSDEGDHWAKMFAVSLAQDEVRGTAEVMGMRLMQGSPSSVANQIANGLSNLYQHPSPCSGL